MILGMNIQVLMRENGVNGVRRIGMLEINSGIIINLVAIIISFKPSKMEDKGKVTGTYFMEHKKSKVY